VPIFDERAPIKSAFGVEVFGEHSGSDYQLMIRVTKRARIPYENMVLQTVLTESGISFDWQGQTHLEWVERLMMPDAIGAPLDFSGGDIQVIPLDFTVNQSWNLDELEITAFVQNLDDKEALQGTKVMVTALAPMGADDDVALPSETRLLGNYPNPFNPATMIQFSLKGAGIVHLEVFNVLGQSVATLIDGLMEAGHHSVVWNGNDASSGIYFYKLTTDDTVSTKKMTLIK
jgi:hypothetical protein